MVGAKKKGERVEGIEPSWPAWKAGTLPLSYTRVAESGNMRGFRLRVNPRRGAGKRVVLEIGGFMETALPSVGRDGSMSRPFFSRVTAR
jgi:hypothetical protein